jgi:hypothetical protein
VLVPVAMPAMEAVVTGTTIIPFGRWNRWKGWPPCTRGTSPQPGGVAADPGRDIGVPVAVPHGVPVSSSRLSRAAPLGTGSTSFPASTRPRGIAAARGVALAPVTPTSHGRRDAGRSAVIAAHQPAAGRRGFAAAGPCGDPVGAGADQGTDAGHVVLVQLGEEGE